MNVEERARRVKHCWRLLCTPQENLSFQFSGASWHIQHPAPLQYIWFSSSRTIPSLVIPRVPAANRKMPLENRDLNGSEWLSYLPSLPHDSSKGHLCSQSLCLVFVSSVDAPGKVPDKHMAHLQETLDICAPASVVYTTVLEHLSSISLQQSLAANLFGFLTQQLLFSTGVMLSF